MIVWLIGYRGSGKSTVARLLAEKLGWNCIDSDAVIEQKVGCNIKEIFEKLGEQGFREIETNVLKELAQKAPAIVAVGGGAVLREENRQTMKRSGVVVWLRASPSTLQKRLKSDNATQTQRPSLTGKGTLEEISDVLAVREPIYSQVADFDVDTDSRSAAEVADSILQRLRGEYPEVFNQ